MIVYHFLPYHCTNTVDEVENGLVSHWETPRGGDATYVWDSRKELGDHIARNIISALEAEERDAHCCLSRYKITLSIERMDEEGGAA